MSFGVKEALPHRVIWSLLNSDILYDFVEEEPILYDAEEIEEEVEDLGTLEYIPEEPEEYDIEMEEPPTDISLDSGLRIRLKKRR